MEKSSKTILEEIQGTLNEIIAQIKKMIREGNARRVVIKNSEGKTLFQSQLTLGVAGTAFFAIYAPILTAITTFVLFASDVKVYVEREVNESEDEYEVEAEVIEIEEEESESQDDADKTVGKKKKK